MDGTQMINAITEKMPNLTETQSKQVADFFNGKNLELMTSPQLYTTAIGTTVGFFLELFREYKFKNPLEELGIIRRGSNVGFNLQRMYLTNDTNKPDDPAYLKGPRNSQGAPLVPMKKTWEFKQRFVPVNLAYHIWTTIWDDMFFSNVSNNPADRIMIIGAITRNIYKHYEEYRYAMESNLVAYNYDPAKLKEKQIEYIDLGSSEYTNITGAGALNLVQTVHNLESMFKVMDYSDYNEEGFKDYWTKDDYVIAVRMGLKSAIEKALMASNYFHTEYVSDLLNRIVEIPCPLTPCKYYLTKDNTELFPVYADENSASNDGNGVVLGLSPEAGLVGQSNVAYNFDSKDVSFKETATDVFGVIIDKKRINWITGPGGEVASSMTVYDAFNKCQDLILDTFGVNAEGNKIGASVFVDRTYPVIYLANNHQGN